MWTTGVFQGFDTLPYVCMYIYIYVILEEIKYGMFNKNARIVPEIMPSPPGKNSLAILSAAENSSGTARPPCIQRWDSSCDDKTWELPMVE